MLKTSDPTPPATSCTDFGFAEVDFPRLPQPRLVVGFADGLQLLLSDPSDIGLAAQLITAIRLSESRQEKGTTR